MATTTKTGLRLFVNGAEMATGAETLAALLAELGYEPPHVATAVNGDFVPARTRTALRLASGDRVEVVSARQGG